MVHEAQTYHLHVDGAAEVRVYLEGEEMVSQAGKFSLAMPFGVGRSTLQVEAGGERRRIRLTLLPDPQKLGPLQWMDLLTDLEAWLPGVTTGVEAPRDGRVGADGAAAPLIVEALLPLLPGLEAALRHLLEAPRTHVQEVPEEEPLRRVREVRRDTLVWIGRHPQVGAWCVPAGGARPQGREPHLPIEVAVDTLDHPVNRFVVWLVREVSQTLDQTAEALERGANAAGTSEDAGRWCRSRAGELRRGAERLRTQLRRSALGRLAPRPATEGALQVVIDHPRYARFHAIARRFLSPRFRLRRPEDGEAPAAMVRPSYGVYELWCLRALHLALEASLPGWRWKASGVDKLLGVSGTGAGATLTFHQGGAEITLHFNPTFSGYLSRGKSHRWSLSGERRPDIVVTYLAKSGPGRWVCLDAKYRVNAANLGDAFTSIHVYRDALRWEGYGGPCAAGALLAPAMLPETAPWFGPDFRAAHGVGVWRLAPGTQDRALAAWILERLGVEGTEGEGADADAFRDAG